MSKGPGPADAYVRVAEIEIDAVAPSQSGFTLSGRGRDRGEYRMELQLEMPIDPRTRAVVAELLSQSRLTLSRRAPQPLRGTKTPKKNSPIG